MPEDKDMIVTGETVCLGPRRKDLIPTYLGWINDPEVNRFLTMWGTAMSLEDEEKWYASTGAPNERLFTIYHRQSMKPIGNTGLHRIDHRHKNCEMGIVLGEKDYWGRGFGTEAVRLVLDFGFIGLGLHSIHLRVLSHNERAIRCYEKAGFKMAGRLRDAFQVGGQYVDHILMDILGSEFESPYLKSLLDDTEGR